MMLAILKILDLGAVLPNSIYLLFNPKLGDFFLV